MEVIKIKCPSCKADIDVTKEGLARCPYCGTGIYAERKDEKVIINTTINNYNMRSKQETERNINNIYKVPVLIGAACMFMFIVVQMYITTVGTRNTSQVGEEISAPRTEVASEPMINFLELVLQKRIEDIGTEDYENFKSIKFESDDEKSIINYELYDETASEVTLYHDTLQENTVDFRDLQCFTKIKSIDIRNIYSINMDFYYYNEADAYLSNLTELESFYSNDFISMEVLENLFADTKNIKELGIRIYEEDDIDTFTDKFSNLEKLILYYVDDEFDDREFRKLAKLDKLESFATYMTRDNAYLASLTNLKYLELRGDDKFTDYSVLFGMPQLESLVLGGAQGLKSIDFVKNMPGLTYLYVEGSDINSLEALDAKPIRSLVLKDNDKLSDYSSLLTLSELNELILDFYMSNDDALTDFSSLINLRKIGIKDSMLKFFENNTQVEELSLDVGLTHHIHMDSISKMTGLTKIDFHGDGTIDDFSGLENLSNLKSVRLGMGTDTDVSPLFNMATIENLDIDTDEPVYIIPENINENTHLKELNIYNIDYLYDNSGEERKEAKLGDMNYIFDKFGALERLTVRSQSIPDVSFVQYMPNLSYLDITDNYVQDISPLVDRENLKVLVCPNNQIANLSLLPDTLMVIN